MEFRIKSLRLRQIFKSCIITLMCLSFLLTWSCNTKAINSQKTYESHEKSLVSHNAVPYWCRDVKTGGYSPCGTYKIGAEENEWYPRWMYFGIDKSEWKGKKLGYHIHVLDELDGHTEKFNRSSKFGYHNMIEQFTAKNFDTEDWVQLFEEKGARFVYSITMQHNGYAFWDSKITPWNVKKMDPKRHITEALFNPSRKQDMKVIATFNLSRNLQKYKEKTLQEVTERYGHLEPNHSFWNLYYPLPSGLVTLSDDPKFSEFYGYTEGQIAVLKSLGQWLKVNAEAIYSIPPRKAFEEGSTKLTRKRNFSAHVEDYTAFGFTQKPKAIYAIVLGAPKEVLSIVTLSSNLS